MKNQVFISYNHANSDIALDVQRQLKNAGFNVWFDNDIPGGAKWREQIENQIRNSCVLVLIMTDDALKSEYVDFEWKFALGAGLVILPLYFDTVNHFPFPLADIQYIDCRINPSWGELFNRVQQAIQEQADGDTKSSVAFVPFTGLYPSRNREKDKPRDY